MRVEDRFGNEFGPGDKVLFSTDARNSGINYGIVLDIVEKTPQYYNHPITKVKIRYLNLDGTPTTQTAWDSVARKHIPTDKLTRASILDYSPSKFVLFN